MTVAYEYGFTEENAPRFTAFATTQDRLYWHMDGEHRPMYVFEEAIREYEYRSNTRLGKLIANRELPVLHRAKEIIDI